MLKEYEEEKLRRLRAKKVSNKSNRIVEELKRRKLCEIFDLLDSDEDGVISA